MALRSPGDATPSLWEQVADGRLSPEPPRVFLPTHSLNPVLWVRWRQRWALTTGEGLDLRSPPLPGCWLAARATAQRGLSSRLCRDCLWAASLQLSQQPEGCCDRGGSQDIRSYVGGSWPAGRGCVTVTQEHPWLG